MARLAPGIRRTSSRRLTRPRSQLPLSGEHPKAEHGCRVETRRGVMAVGVDVRRENQVVVAHSVDPLRGFGAGSAAAGGLEVSGVAGRVGAVGSTSPAQASASTARADQVTVIV